MSKFIKSVGEQMSIVLPFLAVPAAGALASYYFGKKDDKASHAALASSFQTALSIDKNMANNPEAAEARFRELVFVSPTIAKNPAMAAKFISNRLESGLTIDDIHKLSVIEASRKSSPSAQARAYAQAGMIFDRMVTTFGMDAKRQLEQQQQRYIQQYMLKKQPSNLNKTGGAMSSELKQKVSDECLGEMLADRYLVMVQGMQKEAAPKKVGFLPKATEIGAKKLRAGLEFMAPVMVLGGLAHGIGMIVDAQKKKKLDQEANENFAKLKQHSEIVKGNPALAHEALDAIKTFAPALAAKPAVLKTFVEHTINAGMIAPQTVSDLATAQGNVSKSHAPGFASGFFNAVKSTSDAGKFLMPKAKDVAGDDDIDDRW